MLIIPTKNTTNLRCPIWAPKFVLKPKIRTNIPNESLCTWIRKMVGARVIFQNRVAPLNTIIISLILGIWCLIIHILGTNKAQGFKLALVNQTLIQQLLYLRIKLKPKRCGNANKCLFTKDKMWRLSKRGNFFNICLYLKMSLLLS